MAKTYEDTKGNIFSTYEQARASNAGMSITSDSLAPATPIEIPTPAPTTKSDGALGYLGTMAQSGVNEYQKTLDQQAELAKSSKDDALSAYLTSLTSEGQAGATNRLYEQTGVNTAQKELNDVNHQILAEQVALQRQLEALDKNPNGLFGGALEQEKQKVKDESLKRQADLAVIQMSKQGRYDSAKEIADRAVSALMERTQQRNEALRMLYEDRKDLFDKSEQRAFETAQGERERAAQNEEYRLRAEFDQKIRQSDPLYQAQLAKAQADAAAAGASGTTSPYQDERMTRNIQSVNELLGKLNGGVVGVLGSIRSNLPGTEARDFKGSVDTLKSNIAFGELTAMREASKTGGALGQVSDREAQLLQTSLGSLDIGQSKDKFQASLVNINNSIVRWRAAQAGNTNPTGPIDGEMHVYQGKVYQVVNGQWIEQ